MLRAWRALALVVLLLAAPSASAQTEVPDPTPSQTPRELDCAQPVDQCFADLMPTNPRTNASDERYPTTLCTDFLNIGQGPTATSFRVLLTLDDVPVGEKQFNDPYNQGEGEANICWENIALVAGRHTMMVFVDSNNEIPESKESNNQRGIAFIVRPAPKVDLTISSFKVTPTEGGPRMTQLFIINVTNIGTLASTSTTVNLTDGTGHLATFPLHALQPRETRTLIHATRPDTRPVGGWLARAVVDPEGTNHEIDETNNDAYFEYVVLEHPAPDLRFDNIVVAGNLSAYRGVRVNAYIENAGDEVARGVVMRVYNDAANGSLEVSNRNIVLAGRNTSFAFLFTFSPGEHLLRFVLDPLGVVPERNESNNVAYLNLTILQAENVPDAPNLVVERIYALPEDPRPGERISVGALIHNIGTNRSKGTTIAFSVDGVPVGNASVPSLGSDAYHTAYIPWAGGPQGNYDIEAYVDAAALVPELDETDNVLTRQFFIGTLPPPPKPEEPVPEVTPPTNTTNGTPPANQTPTTPKPPTPKPPTPPVARENIAFGELILTTREVPGGLKGIVSASLRNPNIQPLGLVTVQFKIDGKLEKEVLVSGIRGAATTAATSGEIDLPAGKHTVSAEVRIVGSTDAPVIREKEYDAAAGAKQGVPGPGIALALGALVLVGLGRRRS